MSKFQDLTIDKLNSDRVSLNQISQLISYKKLKKIFEEKKSVKKSNPRNLILIQRIFSLDLVFLIILNIIFGLYLTKFIHHYYYKSEILDIRDVFYSIYSYLTSLWLNYNNFEDITQEECALPMPEFLNSITRPISNCKMCIGLKEIKNVDFISKEEFLNKYAYTAVPLVVKNAAKNWSATNVLSFQFLKNLYLNKEFEKNKCGKKCMKKQSKKRSIVNIWQKQSSVNEHLSEDIEENFGDTCQFFGYRTKFKNLIEVFNMNSGNLLLNSKDFKPWYIGW
jgi:hypothetical protein